MKLDQKTKNDIWAAINSRLPKNAIFACFIASGTDGECISNTDEVERYLMAVMNGILEASGKTVQFVGTE
jgi:hypothetical protein